MRRIDAYQGCGVTVFALKLAPMVFLRPLTGHTHYLFSATGQPQRREMLQWWADTIDRPRTEEDLIG